MLGAENLCTHCVGRSCPAGTQPFAAVSNKNGNAQLRLLLLALDIKDAVKHKTHDLRRGHSRDIFMAGASWDELLAQGDWTSTAAPRKSYLPEVPPLHQHSLH